MFSVFNRPFDGIRAPLATILSSAHCNSLDSPCTEFHILMTSHAIISKKKICCAVFRSDSRHISERIKHLFYIFLEYDFTILFPAFKNNPSPVWLNQKCYYLIFDFCPASCVLPSRWSPTAAAVINTPVVYSSPPSWNECHFSSISVLPFTDPWTNGGF